jgi:hypothetical protein
MSDLPESMSGFLEGISYSYEVFGDPVLPERVLVHK